MTLAFAINEGLGPRNLPPFPQSLSLLGIFDYLSVMAKLLTIQSDSLVMEISPALSGRVTRLLASGVNILSGPEANSANFGATYWTSPQSDWGWPPVPEVDGLPYTLLDGGDHPETPLRLRGPPAKIGERLFHIEKYFTQGPLPGTIDVHYSIVNGGKEPFKMANWEIARMPPGGLTFFPTGEAELNGVSPHAFLPIEKVAETTFYDHRSFEEGQCLKLHADGRGGYLAHLAGAWLVLKIFADSPPERQAPLEGECEIFVNDDGKYIEIEVQGPYELILPGARSTFRVRTAVCPLPGTINRTDRAGLRAFADDRAAHFAP